MSKYSEFSREDLERILEDYDRSISWDTNCLNCGALWDRMYELEVVIQKVGSVLNTAWDLNDDKDELLGIIEKYLWSGSGS